MAWIIDEEKTTPHHLVVRDPDGWFEIRARYDGCFEIIRAHNVQLTDPKNDPMDNEFLHVCDFDDFISQLLILREMAHGKFGDEFWEISSLGETSADLAASIAASIMKRRGIPPILSEEE